MKASFFLEELKKRGIDKIAGVPDSTLKSFCDTVKFQEDNLRHYVTVNEGAAIGLAVGNFLADGRPMCVYMQNSGLGNIVNPLTSLANKKIYGIPILFVIGWRGEPGVKDEPQHIFQGEITCELLEVLDIPYSVMDENTSQEQLVGMLEKAWKAFEEERQYALVVKKGTFEPERKYAWSNGYTLNREECLGIILERMPSNVGIVSTTGKISRELYEQSNLQYGHHDNLFMSVGGMGYASMIAFGIAQAKKEQKIVCIDGDGAVLMHMGNLAFLGEQKPGNFYHIVINNEAHESVGAMPTGCRDVSVASVAKAVGYRQTMTITEKEDLEKIGALISEEKGPILIEVKVSLESRADLGRPKESAMENRNKFMKYMRK